MAHLQFPTARRTPQAKGTNHQVFKLESNAETRNEVTNLVNGSHCEKSGQVAEDNSC